MVRSQQPPPGRGGLAAHARGAGHAPPTLSSSPTQLREALDSGLTELRLDLGNDERERLLSYLALLQRWNRVYNLTAIRDPQAMLVQHLLDSLAVLPHLQALAAEPSHSPGSGPLATRTEPSVALLDVGSGAGLPGIPLAIAWSSLRVDLVEPVGKKTAFLRQCAGELGLSGRVRAHACRVEQLAPGAFDFIVCRAFASLADFVQAIASQVGPTTRVLALKGQRPEAEIAALPSDWRVDAVRPLAVPGLDAERHLVLMSRPGDAGSAAANREQ